MAIAKKCDVCGKLYEMYNTKNDPTKTNGFMLLNIDKERKYFSHGVIDCCPDCNNSIIAHIDTLGRCAKKK